MLRQSVSSILESKTGSSVDTRIEFEYVRFSTCKIKFNKLKLTLNQGLTVNRQLATVLVEYIHYVHSLL